MSDDILTCIECGHEINPNDRFCPNCKCNTKPAKPVEPPKIVKKLNPVSRFLEHPVWNMPMFLIGIWQVLTRDIETETLYFFLSVFIVIFTSRNLYKYYKNKSKRSQNQSIDILKERYAKGEITKEEFDKIKEDLE